MSQDQNPGALGSFMHEFSSVFRVDSWRNLVTGVGYALRDKVKSTTFSASDRISPETLDALYHDDDLISTLCDTVPEEMLRKGFDVDISDEENKDREHEWEENCQTFLKDMQVINKFTDAGVWSRLYGGAAIFPILDDGSSEEELSEPLDLKRIREIKSINVIEGRYLQPQDSYEDANEEKYGEIKTWRITPYSTSTSLASSNLVVHETRLIIFNGTRSSVARKQRNKGFSDSLVQRVYDTIQMYSNSWMSVGHLLSDANQAVFKIKNLMHMIASNDNTTITNRMQLVDMCRSVARAIALDADGEEFERHTTNFSGLEPILQMFSLRLSSAFRMPATILMGQSPAGENATGDADFRWFYDRIESSQENNLEPKLRRFFEIAFAAKNGPTSGVVPKKWSIKFRPLQRMTEKEQGEIRKLQAETDKIEIDAGIVLAEEVTLSRHTRDGWKPDTNVDLDLREEMLKLEKEKAIEDLENPPEPPVPGQFEQGQKPEDQNQPIPPKPAAKPQE